MKILLFKKNDNISDLWGSETSIVQKLKEFRTNHFGHDQKN